MNRRDYLALAGTAGTATLAGCGLFETRSARSPPLVEDRPDAVYVPTHVEGMKLVGTASAGRLRIALSYSFPHRFWLVTGDRTNEVDIRSADSVHLMVSVWDADTGMVVPSSNATVTITRDGETVVQKSMWPMLSQNMGVHFGDNVALEGEGTYDVTVEYGPVGVRRGGAFAGTFGEAVTTSYTVEYSENETESISYRTLEDRQGQRDAVAPMDVEMLPIHRLPPANLVPGRVLGQGTSGDATLVATTLERPPAGVDGDGPYLVVSARTPYNRYPLPLMSMAATVERGGEAVFDGPLTATLAPAPDFHYGAVLGTALESGDALTITPQTPPQTARHEGYETAFLSMDPVELSV